MVPCARENREFECREQQSIYAVFHFEKPEVRAFSFTTLERLFIRSRSDSLIP